MLAEFFGTFILIVFGVGVVAQVVLSKHTAGDTLSINIAWGLAVTMGCYVSAGVTGAHLNPAVTLALAVHRSFPWSKVLPYSLAQIAGAFVASAVVFVTYHEALDAFDGGVRQVLGAQGTAGIWATYPQPFLSTFPGGFIDQVVGTALLVGVIFGITDTRNSPAPAGLAPVVVGLLVVLIGATFGFNAGYAINPARDFGPRLFTFVGGLGRRSVPRRQRLVVGADRGAVRRRRARRLGLRPLRREPLPGVGVVATFECKGRKGRKAKSFFAFFAVFAFLSRSDFREHIPHFRGQRVDRERLLDELRAGGADAAQQHRIVGIAGHEQHARRRPATHDELGQLAAVHARHHHVGQQQIDRFAIALGDLEPPARRARASSTR